MKVMADNPLRTARSPSIPIRIPAPIGGDSPNRGRMDPRA
jgi:hypothetical protein